MADIARTEIGTSYPVSICKGLPIYPKGIYLPYGVDGQGTLFNKSATVLGMTFSVGAQFSYFFGICGPGWGTRMVLNNGSTSGQDVSFTVDGDELVAGMTWGASLGLSFEFGLESKYCWVSKWWGWVPLEWKCALKTEWKIPAKFELDLLMMVKLAMAAIISAKYANKVMPEDEVGDVLVDIFIASTIEPNIFGIADYAEGSYHDNRGVMRANPKLEFPVNIWDLIVLLAEQVVAGGTATAATGFGAAAAAVAAVIVGFAKLLKFATIEIGFGPSFGIVFPVSVKVNKIFLNNVEYSENVYYNYDAKELRGTTTGTPPTSIMDINVEFAQSPGIDFYIGVFANASIFLVFSVAFEAGLNIVEAMGLNLNFATFNQTLPKDAEVGSSFPNVLSINKGCAPCGTGAELYEVVFE